MIHGLNPSIPSGLAPDLAVEVDISSFSRDKMSIYQAIGVPEVWVYRQGQLKIYAMRDRQYIEVSSSPTFSIVSTQHLQSWIQFRENNNDLKTLREVRRFCREQAR